MNKQEDVISEEIVLVSRTEVRYSLVITPVSDWEYNKLLKYPESIGFERFKLDVRENDDGSRSVLFSVTVGYTLSPSEVYAPWATNVYSEVKKDLESGIPYVFDKERNGQVLESFYNINIRLLGVEQKERQAISQTTRRLRREASRRVQGDLFGGWSASIVPLSACPPDEAMNGIFQSKLPSNEKLYVRNDTALVLPDERIRRLLVANNRRVITRIKSYYNNKLMYVVDENRLDVASKVLETKLRIELGEESNVDGRLVAGCFGDLGSDVDDPADFGEPDAPEEESKEPVDKEVGGFAVDSVCNRAARLVNLSTHVIKLILDDGLSSIEIHPAGMPVRVNYEYTDVGFVNGVKVVSVRYGDILNLPEPEDGVMYVVSSMVTQALAAKRIVRPDVVSPDTSNKYAKRDEHNMVLGTAALRSYTVGVDQ